MKEEKIYSLKRDNPEVEEFGYLDQDGVSFNSPANWLFTGILGGCGCGSSESLGEKAVLLLKYFATEHPLRERKEVDPYDSGFWELMAHWFDSAELIEHGTGIGSSWLTKKGDQIYKSVVELEHD